MKLKHYFIIIIILIIILCLKTYTIFFFVVDGNSMYPTYKNGQIVWANHSYININRNDVVLVSHTEGSDDNTLCIKRVYLIPGDYYIKAFKLNSKYFYTQTVIIQVMNLNKFYEVKEKLHNLGYCVGWAPKPEKIDKDQYFILGDNKNNSIDSRDFGAVDKKNIIAKIYN